jgi:hypothetical protein
MLPAEPSREDVMIRNINNRMVTSSPLRPYGYRPITLQKLSKQKVAAEIAPTPDDDFQGGHNID